MPADRIAIVTGATRGLGLATATALAERGMRVVVTHRGDASSAQPALDAVAAAGSEALAMPLDVADVASIERLGQRLPDALRDRWGRDRVDVLVNNAGVGRWGAVGQVDPADLDALLDVNVRGTILTTQAVVPHLVDGGSIVSISSMLTRRVSPGTAAYAASKAAIETYSLGLALELGARRIRVNVVAPGPTATDFNGGAMRDDEAMRASLAADTAFGRVGEPDDVAAAIALLASDDAAWITGQRIEASGGALL
ncbi:SDR family NAD(P)-dependent oxidoreductase [Agrococcus sp. SGAir0287]|uniref:SDR family NAD(P)-dependent oxidoreductase n=1 Tax=Agrococcus sp. SGAir0287 TaxID=2070347 RepID=UPI0010CCF951|nr:SDR family oxidoreductase [Agrococcus sp. SGAir0287]QCR20423.1 3-oxoacyl-ACP reductase [Agrococcus sp. SGAir0287]